MPARRLHGNKLPPLSKCAHESGHLFRIFIAELVFYRQHEFAFAVQNRLFQFRITVTGLPLAGSEIGHCSQSGAHNPPTAIGIMTGQAIGLVNLAGSQESVCDRIRIRHVAHNSFANQCVFNMPAIIPTPHLSVTRIRWLPRLLLLVMERSQL